MLDKIKWSLQIVVLCVVLLILNCSGSPTSGDEEIKDEDIKTYFETEGEEELWLEIPKEKLSDLQNFNANFRYQSFEQYRLEPRFDINYFAVIDTQTVMNEKLLILKLTLLHQIPVEGTYEIIDYGTFDSNNQDNGAAFSGKVVARLEYYYSRRNSGMWNIKTFTSNSGTLEIRKAKDGNVIVEFGLSLDWVAHQELSDSGFTPIENALQMKGSYRTWAE